MPRKKPKPAPRTGPRRPRGSGGCTYNVQRQAYSVEVKLTPDPLTGKPRKLSRYVYGPRDAETLRAAHVVLEQLCTLRDRGALRRRSEVPTFGQFATQWLDTVVRPTRTPRTVMQYEGKVRNYLVPAFGARRLDSLTAPEIQAFFAALAVGNARARRPPLAPKTRGTIYDVLKLLLDQAVAWHYLLLSPLESVVRPPDQRLTEPRQLTTVEAQRLVVAAEAEPVLGALWLTSLFTGLRAGELRALRWRDLDLERGQVTITGALGAQGERKGPKTPAGRRAFHLPAFLVTLLRTRAAEQDPPSELIFPNQAGRPYAAPRLWALWGAFRTAHGLPADVLLKNLRHTHGSALIRSGAGTKTVQARLGHADARTTMGSYLEASGEDDREAVERMASLLRPEGDPRDALLGS